jgi:hypothetical protein
MPMAGEFFYLRIIKVKAKLLLLFLSQVQLGTEKKYDIYQVISILSLNTLIFS